MTTRTTITAVSATTDRSRAVTAAVAALLGGVFLVFTMGFAHPDMVHNAAHDWRHAMSFPCH